MKKQIEELLISKMSEVENAFPSIFSKEDVLGLLKTIQNEVDDQNGVPGNLKDLIKEIKEEVSDIISNHDYEDIVELDLYDKRIEVSIDSSDLRDEVRDAIDSITERFLNGWTEKNLAVSGE